MFTQDTRGLQLVLLRTLTRNPLKICYILYLQGEKETPKQLQVRCRISSDPTVGRPGGRPTQVCSRPPGRPLNAFCHCITYQKCRRSTDPTGFLFLVQHRSTEQSTNPSLVHVDRPPGRSKPVIEFKKLYLLFLTSLYILHLGEDFSNLSRSIMNT